MPQILQICDIFFVQCQQLATLLDVTRCDLLQTLLHVVGWELLRKVCNRLNF